MPVLSSVSSAGPGTDNPSRPRASRLLTVCGLVLAVGCTSQSASPDSSSPPVNVGVGGVAYGAEQIGYKAQPTDTNSASATSASNTPATGQGSAASGGTDAIFAASPIIQESPQAAPQDTAAPAAPPAPSATATSSSAPTNGTPSDTTPISAPDAGPTPGKVGESGARVQASPFDAAAPFQTDAGVPTTGANADAGVSPPADDAGAAPAEPVLCALPEPSGLLENPFRRVQDMPASTFSIDVDGGSYSLARASLRAGALPNPESVRIEEFLNYFDLHYALPKGGAPFSVYSELGACPWQPAHQLMLVGLQGQEVPLADQPPANLVFLLDVSGSMNQPNKLPLLKQGFRMMTRQLRPQDRVSIVTYAGADTVVLDGTPGDQQDTILAALDTLQAGGSTNGEGGIQRAYALAQEHFITDGNNRVLLATDGDFNVGLSQTSELADFIATKRDTGVFLSVYGFGDPSGNYQDATAEQLADNGNGIYFFIDSPEEARRAFVHTITGSLLTVAKDVKLQVQFNPQQVKGYRLIGYENRVLSNADFNNDAVDAGELGAGLSVTALFEVIPVVADVVIPQAAPGTDPLPAEGSPSDPATSDSELPPVAADALVDVRIRYKGATADSSELLTQTYRTADIFHNASSMKFLFASAVAEFGQQLRGSQYLPEIRKAPLRAQIAATLPADADGAIEELLQLVTLAQSP